MVPAQQEGPRRLAGGARGPQSTFARALQQATAPVRPSEGAGGSGAAGQRQVQGGGHRKAASLRVTVVTNGNDDNSPNGQQAQQQRQQQFGPGGQQQQQAAGVQQRGAAAAPSVFARLSRAGPSGGPDPLGPSGSTPSGTAAQGAWDAEEEWEGMGGPSPVEGGAGGGALLSDQEALKQRMRRMELELTRLRAEAGEAAGRGGVQPGAAVAAARARCGGREGVSPAWALRLLWLWSGVGVQREVGLSGIVFDMLCVYAGLFVFVGTVSGC